MDKKFLCYWGTGYNDEGATSIVSESQFKEEIGYTLRMVELVTELDIGEVADLTEMGAQHLVIRVE